MVVVPAYRPVAGPARQIRLTSNALGLISSVAWFLRAYVRKIYVRK